MEDKIVLFDIDYTLIETTSFAEEIQSSLRKFITKLYPEINAEEAVVIYDRVIRSYISNLSVDMHEVFANVADELGLNKNNFIKQNIRLFENLDYRRYLYRDVEEILKELTLQSSLTLGVFSEGDSWFQMLKLEKSRLIKYFDSDLIFLSQNKLENLDSIPEGSIIFDDSDRIVDGIRNSERTDIQVMKVNPLFGLRQEDVDKILMINKK